MTFEEFVKETYSVDISGLYEADEIAEKIATVTDIDLDDLVQEYVDKCDSEGWMTDMPSSLDEYVD